MLHYTVYKITNTINGKIYIGCHQTKDIDDGYMGSGKYLKHAKEKYGIENFTKEILATFDSIDQMFSEEKNLISKLSPEYNIHEGGKGGWNALNDRFKTDKNFREHWIKRKKETLREFHKNNPGVWKGKIKSTETKRKISESKKNYYKHNDASFFGKQHTDATKAKIGTANSVHQKGNGNSQYGTMWITNEMENKKIKKEDSIPEGWIKGRKIK